MLKLAYTTYIRPLLEFSISACTPIHKTDRDSIEKIQNFVTRRIHYISFGFTYENKPTADARNKRLNLDSLADRRLISEMKILNKIVFSNIHLANISTDFFSLRNSRTRGAPFSINIERTMTHQREWSFAARTVKHFNSIFSTGNFPTNYSQYMSKVYHYLQQHLPFAQ